MSLLMDTSFLVSPLLLCRSTGGVSLINSRGTKRPKLTDHNRFHLHRNFKLTLLNSLSLSSRLLNFRVCISFTSCPFFPSQSASSSKLLDLSRNFARSFLAKRQLPLLPLDLQWVSLIFLMLVYRGLIVYQLTHPSNNETRTLAILA